jgi:hypothetical protein
MNFSLHIERDIKKCEQIWADLGVKDNYNDLWDYRYCFFKGYKNKPMFICAKYRGKIVACMPLEHFKKDDTYRFFGGGDWNENMKILCRPEYRKEAIPFLISHVPQNSRLIFMTAEDAKFSKKIVHFEPTYYIDLASIEYDQEKFFDRMDNHKQRKIRSEFRKIEGMNPFYTLDKFEDFDIMVKLNLKRFGEESSFNDKGFVKAFHCIMKHKVLKRHLSSLSIYIGGKLKAHALLLEYNGQLTYLQGGNDTDVQNIAKFLSYRVLLEGIRRKVSRVNYMSDDCGWKEHWRLDKEMQYILKIDDNN